MLPREVQVEHAFHTGLWHVPYGTTVLHAGASAFSDLKQSLKQHALGDGVVQWAGPAAANVAEEHLNMRAVTLQLTNYRVLIHYQSGGRPPQEVPLASIAEVAKGRSGGGVYWIDIMTKLPLALRIATDNEVRINSIAREIVIRIPRRLKDTFAYAGSGVGASLPATASQSQSTLAYPPLGGGFALADLGWGIYNVQAEFARMAISRGTTFTILPFHDPVFVTYPTHCIVPAAASVELYQDVARFRQNGRVPVISWVDAVGTAVLARSSQPLVGGLRRTSPPDEMLCAMLIGAEDELLARQPKAPSIADATVTTPMTMTGPPPSLIDNSSFNAWTAPPPDATPTPTAEQTSADTVVTGPVARSRTLHIMDCRSRAAAAANSANGGGHEQTAHYIRTVSHFLSLANIHRVRKSYTALQSVCALAQAHTSTSAWGSSKAPHASFWTKLHETEWPTLTQKLLFAATRTAEVLAAGDTALVHCTDGWDRTSQVCALSMLLLDPYYRSVAGFCILVEQEWLRMGHRFADRCAADASHHVTSAADSASAKVAALLSRLTGESDDEDAALDAQESATGATIGINDAKGIKPVPSPVFLQFLDATYQLLRMFPESFEFTPALLQLLAEAAYNGRFGTFLGNTHRSRHERQRHVSGASPATRLSASCCSATPSLWGHIASLVHAENASLRVAAGRADALAPRLVNPFYRVAGESPEQQMTRQLSRYGFPPSLLGQVGPSAPPPPQGRSVRLVPSFHSKRYTFWAPLLLKGDFDTPGDLNRGSCYDVACGLESIESPALDPHVALLSRLAHMCRAAAAAGTSTSLSSATATPPVPDPNTAVLGMFPCALASADDFQHWNCLPELSAAEAFDAAAEDFAPDDDRNRAGTPPTTLTAEAEEQAMLSPSPIPAAALSVDSRSAESSVFFIPREDSAVCYMCDAPFSLFARRHTCRMCARSVCSKCGGVYATLMRGQIALKDEKHLAGQRLRICLTCHVKLRTSGTLASGVANTNGTPASVLVAGGPTFTDPTSDDANAYGSHDASTGDVINTSDPHDVNTGGSLPD
jgi:hypothetical protein